MSVTVKLYGDLRDLAVRKDSMTESIGVLELDDFDASAEVTQLLDVLGLEESDVSHIFVNRKYSAITKTIKNGDRVALFPSDMGLLYHWYFPKEE
ncbi:hypothetical protein KGY64_05725 [Candidatus Bipolaricaulota bacterium]|nr:hypothetical protein [Candidatus Bipolaricaulota bacterium]